MSFCFVGLWNQYIVSYVNINFAHVESEGLMGQQDGEAQ